MSLSEVKTIDNEIENQSCYCNISGKSFVSTIFKTIDARRDHTVNVGVAPVESWIEELRELDHVYEWISVVREFQDRVVS